MGRIGKVLMAALFASAVWTPAAHAEPEFFTVTIDLVGQSNPGILGFRFTGSPTSGSSVTPGFTFKRFVHTGALTKEFLAIALTAASLDASLFVFTDPADGMAPEIIQMFLVP